MTDRDRLIELVNKAKEEYANDITDHTETDYIVECLLNNGVIVPPCKVGDKVYIKNRPLIISFLHIENEVYYVVQFDCDDCGDCPFYEDEVSFEGEHDCKTNGYIQFTEKDIGKTVFLTKEEAEEKLRELKDNVDL